MTSSVSTALPAELQKYGSNVGLDLSSKIPQKYKPIVMYADTSRINRTFERFGYVTAPFVHFAPANQGVIDAGLKAIFKTPAVNHIQQQTAEAHKAAEKHHQEKQNFDNLRYELFLPKKWAFLPNEFIEEIVTKAGYDIQSTHSGHYGYAKYWTLLSKYKAKINSDVKDDEVQVGCVVRNSINGGVALGADLFTYRLQCKNGAIARGANLGSLALRHLRDETKMANDFKRGFDLIIETSKKLIAYYEQARKIKVNENMMKRIVERTRSPDRYLPRYVETEWGTNKSGHRSELKKVTMSSDHVNKVDLWQVFNDITQPLWHNMVKTENGTLTKKSDAIHFSMTSRYEIGLHRALMEIVDSTAPVKRSV